MKIICIFSILILLQVDAFSCSQNCQSCTSQNNCTMCSSLFFLNHNTNLCQPCPQNCIQCFNKTTCNLCIPFYYVNQTNICESCPSGCIGCNSDNNCSSCINTYYLNESNVCEFCLQNCILCSDGNNCMECKNEYYLIQGICYQRNTKSNIISLSVNIIILCLSPILACIFITITFFIVVKRCPQNQKQQYHSYSTQIQKYKGNDQICCICLQSNTDTITNCCHYFHMNCFETWYKQKKQCPICKRSCIHMITIVLCLLCKQISNNFNIFDHDLMIKIEQQRQKLGDHKCIKNKQVNETQIQMNMMENINVTIQK